MLGEGEKLDDCLGLYARLGSQLGFETRLDLQ